jgi:4'-phosphopantetheinyl transferase
VRDLRALPAAEQPRAFFEYWTLKEAYIKARGLGLALPLHQFAFALRPGQPPLVRFEPGFDDEAHWQFWQGWPTPVHRVSLAVEREGADLSVSLHPRPPESLRA